MNYILFDNLNDRQSLLPLTYLRPVSEIRIGITTITEKWKALLSVSSVSYLTAPYLQKKYSSAAIDSPACYINGAIIPNEALVAAIDRLQPGQQLCAGEKLIAFCSETAVRYEDMAEFTAGLETIATAVAFDFLQQPSDIFHKNGTVLLQDFSFLTKNKISQPLSATNQLIGDVAQLFIEEGAKVECSILNTATGPIYIAKDAEIMEGSIIRGPFALCDHAGVKMGAKIYGPTTIGPHCKVGGEISNCVFFSYSNKGHDGFLGNSVVGEWCNFGADSNTSNLKNNYGDVDVWRYTTERYEDTGLQFHGLIMGDHAKCGINTMFNTGTVVGISANIFGGDFPPKFIPSFTWGGAQWLRTFIFDKAMDVAVKMMERRGVLLTAEDIEILRYVYEKEEKYRTKK